MGLSQVGFGNARAVRVYFDEVRARQAKRIQKLQVKTKKPPLMYVHSPPMHLPLCFEATFGTVMFWRCPVTRNLTGLQVLIVYKNRFAVVTEGLHGCILQERGVSCDIFEFTREDLLGARITEEHLKHSSAYKVH